MPDWEKLAHTDCVRQTKAFALKGRYAIMSDDADGIAVTFGASQSPSLSGALVKTLHPSGAKGQLGSATRSAPSQLNGPKLSAQPF